MHAESPYVIFSASAGNLDALINLYASGVCLHSSSDYDRRTALHLAASNGHEEIIKYLLAVSKDPKQLLGKLDRFGNTPLVDAEREGHKTCAELLK